MIIAHRSTCWALLLLLLALPLKASFLIYVVDTANNRVVVIDGTTNAVTGSIATNTVAASKIAITPDGTNGYVTDAGSSAVSHINLLIKAFVSLISVGAAQQGIAITPDGTKAYVALFSSPNNIAVINIANNIATTVSGFNQPVAVAITPDGKTAYIANQGTSPGFVTPVTIATNALGAPITVGVDPLVIAITPDGTKAYVSNNGDGTVSVIDVATNTVVATITLGAGTTPNGIAITPDGTKAYVVQTTPGTVAVIDVATNSVINPGIAVSGTFPVDIAITPDGATAYVTALSGVVTPIDIATNTPGTAITVAGASFNGIAIATQAPFVGNLRRNIFLNRTEFVLTFTANPFTQSAIIGYVLYNSTGVLATTSAKTPIRFVLNYPLATSSNVSVGALVRDTSIIIPVTIS